MWHKQTPEIDSSEPTFFVALANLFNKFDQPIDPAVLARIFASKKLKLSLDTTQFSNSFYVDVKETSEWPDTNNAIVKFRYKDPNGKTKDHYCLLADERSHTIIDSLDAVIKSSAPYGLPIAHATYVSKTTDPEEIEDLIIEQELHDMAQPKGNSDRIYRLKKDESIWTVGMRYKIPIEDLVEHNDIADPHAVKEGYELRLPIALTNNKDNTVTYEVLPSPLIMHVNKTEGARKWNFGNARKWSDLSNSGPLYMHKTMIEIVAIANVPIEGKTAAYYMDRNAFGNWPSTGRVNYSIGYNWQDLTEGEYVKPEPEFVPEPVEIPTISPEPEVVVEPEPLSEKDALPTFTDAELDHEVKAIQNGVSYKTTYQPFPDGPRDYTARRKLVVREMDGRKANKQMTSYEVKIAGTFMKNKVEYGRPANTLYWYGIPMDLLESDDELYNVSEKKQQKLNTYEKGYAYISRGAAKATNLNKLFNKNYKIKRIK